VPCWGGFNWTGNGSVEKPRNLFVLLSASPVIALHLARTAGSFFNEKRAKKRTICLIAQQLGLPHAITAH
jgi:hypothetical protein